MSKEAILERIAEVFEDILDVDADEVDENLSQETCDEWDSLAQMTLLVSIENEFGIKFPAKVMAQAHSVAAILEALAAEGVA